jgi:pimeloyl-ACP methyl ester carboxylesterase
LHRFTADDGIEIVYRQWGPEDADDAVVLQHGFIADGVLNWEAPGVVAALVDDGHRVVAPDARGHGRSGKPHDAAFYGEARMARDLVELFDVLGLRTVRLAGYSMGAIVSLLTATIEPRVVKLAVGGIGRGAVELGGVDRRVLDPDALIAALENHDADSIVDAEARGFRAFADAVGGDLLALAAQARSIHREPIRFEQITVPSLVIAGADDPLAREPEVLRDAIAGAQLAIVAGDHLGAVGPEFSTALCRFMH